MGCQKRLWCLHPRRNSSSVWTQPWATCFSWSFIEQKGWIRHLQSHMERSPTLTFLKGVSNIFSVTRGRAFTAILAEVWKKSLALQRGTTTLHFSLTLKQSFLNSSLVYSLIFFFSHKVMSQSFFIFILPCDRRQKSEGTKARYGRTGKQLQSH